MKKIIVTIILLIICNLTMRSQAVLEHTYPQSYVSHTKLDNYGWVYYFTTGSSTLPVLKIFSIDHVMIKQFYLSIPTGFIFYGVSNVSDELFNLDNKIEVLYVSFKLSTGDYDIVLYNEDGVLKQSFPNQSWAYIFDIDGDFKLETVSYKDSTTSIYSLPGTMVSAPEKEPKEEMYTVYPNPCTDQVTIAYPPNTRQIVITDDQGRVVRECAADFSGSIHFNTSSLAPGTYLYCIKKSKGNNLGGKFMVVR